MKLKNRNKNDLHFMYINQTLTLSLNILMRVEIYYRNLNFSTIVFT